MLAGCLPQRSNPINSAFNDLTAHYNAYWIANERIKEIETSLFDKYEWNYNKILPIYVPFDSTDAAALKEQTEDCIKKASISIQHHPESKWEYPAYILVGKARFYSTEFSDAVEAFKYVNTKSQNDDVRHEALIDLLRTFTANLEYQNAEAVIDHMAKEDLSDKNARVFYLNQAEYYQQRGNLNNMVQNLVKAEELFTSKKDKARIQFIIGQVYQELGFDGSAFYYYQNSLKNNPSYELSFHTKLNMAQVTELSEGKDVKTIRKYFKKLRIDRKNLEYNDKIYFEMGLFELKNGNMPGAIENFKTSVRVSQNNNRQKGLSFLSLAKVYYDSLKNYEVAKVYYDSTVNTLPKDEEDYAFIKERQEVLEEFVKHITTIRLNDSLLHLATLSPDSLRSWVAELVTRDSVNAANKQLEQERMQRIAQQRENKVEANEGDLISVGATGSWYFDNPSSVSKGLTNFQRRWKSRTLEDHWRRSNKISTALDPQSQPQEKTNLASANAAKEKKAESSDSKAQAILAKIPSTDEQKASLKAEILQALYALGNIYYFRLEEKENAIQTFEKLLSRFPGSDYEPEVLYQLYLLQQDLNPAGAVRTSERLVSEHPESIYAKLISNPNYREEAFAATIQLQKVYKTAYSLHKMKDYKGSRTMLDSMLAIYPDNEFSDNLAMLRALNTGYLEGQHKYQFELDLFVKNYPESEMTEYARSLITQVEEYKVNLYSSSKGQYLPSPDQLHYFLLVYKSSQENAELVTDMITGYFEVTNQPNEKFGNILLSESHSMLVISDLIDGESAMQFKKDFESKSKPFETLKGEEHFIFVISEENFDKLYKTKDIESYRSFFDKNYR